MVHLMRVTPILTSMESADKEWRTALVGTLGAGGKGVFALDVTFLNPNDYEYDGNLFRQSRFMGD